MSVRVNNISKSYGSVKALRKISLSIETGELFGLIGPDGAGKTSLFRIIASLMKPDSGNCQVLGFDTVADYRQIRQIIGYMPGRFSLYMDLTVEENLDFYAKVFGTTVREHYDLISDIYRYLEPFKKRLAGKLSGGMKQKLALCCALIHRPKLLILDEPTTGVDAVSRKEFWDMLQKIKKEGITILVSTPYMDEASLCDRIGLLQKGNLLSVGSPGHIKDSFSLPIFSISSSGSAYRYLKVVRDIEGCRTAWLFGDELHVTLESREFIEPVSAIIRSWEDSSLKWKQIEPGIEDAFIELMMKTGDTGIINKSITDSLNDG
ncbi:MAG: ABC transporter ATP-binding protein [Bacteroidales bacterium]|nr:ABC transporter ATP-binding protein [Bacteroidales bacterium]